MASTYKSAVREVSGLYKNPETAKALMERYDKELKFIVDIDQFVIEQRKAFKERGCVRGEIMELARALDSIGNWASINENCVGIIPRLPVLDVIEQQTEDGRWIPNGYVFQFAPKNK